MPVVPRTCTTFISRMRGCFSSLEHMLKVGGYPDTLQENHKIETNF